MNNNNQYKLVIFALSWTGIFIGIFIFITWKQISGKYFTPYTIFMIFFFLFNFGQCLMWAIGIHSPNEIGVKPLYPGWGIANDLDIVKAQLLTITCIISFHTASMHCFKKNIILSSKVEDIYNEKKYELTLKIMYKVSFFIGLIVIPVTIYEAFKKFQIAQIYGYKALYYSEYSQVLGGVIGILPKMFFGVLVGMLIGSKFSKNTRIYVYTVFFIYFLLNVMSGDRGSWIYSITILIWLSHTYYKKISAKKILLYIILGTIVLYIVNAIVTVRDIGISYEAIKETINIKNSAVVDGIFEMGGSMAPLIILQKYGWNIWPYTNSYLLSIITMLTTKIATILNIPFGFIGSWFSQEYLKISYGAGFSIIAEAFMNYGPYITPLFLAILGYIISSVLYINKNIDYKRNPIKVMFTVLTLSNIILITRGYLHFVLKDWLYGTFSLLLAICIINNIVIKYKNNS